MQVEAEHCPKCLIIYYHNQNQTDCQMMCTSDLPCFCKHGAPSGWKCTDCYQQSPSLSPQWDNPETLNPTIFPCKSFISTAAPLIHNV